MNRKERIAEQLGMPQSTANHKLRKNIMFEYVKKAGDNYCFKCGSEIDSVDDITIEHKMPWEGRDADLFWDIGNIAFSHAACNKPHRYYTGMPPRDCPEGQLWCGACKHFLPVERFAKSNRNATGYQTRCKKCTNEQRRKG